MDKNEADRHHVLYHKPGGYLKGDRHLHRFMLTVKPGTLADTMDVDYTDMDPPGVTDDCGKFTVHADSTGAALDSAKSRLDMRYPDLEGTLVAYGFGSGG
jgi:hypothetical protein